jgi:hypothetical protein
VINPGDYRHRLFEGKGAAGTVRLAGACLCGDEQSLHLALELTD